MVIKAGTKLPTLAMKFESQLMPKAQTVQVAADSQSVTVAYLDGNGVALDVREFSVQENPELGNIVRFTYFDDVWDMELVLSLVDLVDPEETVEMLPLIPAYIQSLEAAAS